jgi:hypothetical protein
METAGHAIGVIVRRATQILRPCRQASPMAAARATIVTAALQATTSPRFGSNPPCREHLRL